MRDMSDMARHVGDARVERTGEDIHIHVHPEKPHPRGKRKAKAGRGKHKRSSRR